MKNICCTVTLWCYFNTYSSTMTCWNAAQMQQAQLQKQLCKLTTYS